MKQLDMILKPYGMILVLIVHLGIQIAHGAETGLVAHWKFDETSGTTALDSSGNGYSGTLLNGATWGSGHLGGALVLDGINDYVSIPDYDLAQGVGSFSVSLWLQSPTGASTADRKIVGTADAGRETFSIRVARSGSTGKINFQVSSVAVAKPVVVVADARFTSTAWTHVVGIYDGARLSLYVNGVLQTNSTALSGATYNSKKTLEVSSTAQPFGGKVDDIRIYHRVLSSAEVSALYSMTDPVPDITPPTVAITSPVEGAVVMGTIPLQATAQDNVAVAGVRFFVDGVIVGSEDTAPPYEVPWDTLNVANGIHSITAVARDTSNNEASSSPINVMVNNPDLTPPTVAITSPVEGAEVMGTIPLQATAQDNVAVAGVRFLVDGVVVGSEDTTPPYEVSWDTLSVANGIHTIMAVARDSSNNEASSSPINVAVNNLDLIPPTAAITSPVENAVVMGTIPLQATAQDNVAVAGVRFFVDGILVGSEDTAPPYEVSWNTLSVANGIHSIMAVARDPSNNEASSPLINVTVNNLDTVPPTVAITSPVEGAVVTGTIAIQATAQDNVAVAEVRFFVDGFIVGSEDTSTPYEVSWNTLSVANGIHTITAVALDTSSNETVSQSIEVTVNNGDTTAPTVDITSPLEDAMVVGTISLQATAQDNVAVAGVRFFVDGFIVGSEDTSPPYEVSWDSLSVVNGIHSITAVARDTSNNEAVARSIEVMVNNPDITLPTIIITEPAAGSIITSLQTVVPIKATANDDRGVAGVSFFVDGVSLAAEDTVSPYEVMWDTATASEGNHAIMAVARDTSGNTNSTTISVTVSRTDISGGLMAYWKFDESGGTGALDSSGHGYTATLLNGGTWGRGI